MQEKHPEILIIGDSNLKHLSQMALKDSKLASLPIVINAVSGRRASDLDNTDLENAMKYRFVILMVGNNDLGAFRERTASPPIDVACKLIAFKELLTDNGTRVRVIKMLPRNDVNPNLIQSTNVILKRHLGRNLFSSMTIYIKKFRTRGGYHPVPSGRMDLLRGLFKACQTFGFGAWPRNPKLLNFNCFSFEADLLFEKPNVVFCAFNCIPLLNVAFWN